MNCSPSGALDSFLPHEGKQHPKIGKKESKAPDSEVVRGLVVNHWGRGRGRGGGFCGGSECSGSDGLGRGIFLLAFGAWTAASRIRYGGRS